jgi:hypothetical protein
MNAVARLGAGEVYYGPAASVVLRTEVGLVRLRKKKKKSAWYEAGNGGNPVRRLRSVAPAFVIRVRLPVCLVSWW